MQAGLGVDGCASIGQRSTMPAVTGTIPTAVVPGKHRQPRKRRPRAPFRGALVLRDTSVDRRHRVTTAATATACTRCMGTSSLTIGALDFMTSDV